jgi:hypothetical protein
MSTVAIAAWPQALAAKAHCATATKSCFLNV